MIRVIVTNDLAPGTSEFFGRLREVFTAKKIVAELLLTSNINSVISNIRTDKYYYDILILDTGENSGLRVAAALRARNLIPSVIFRCDSAEDPRALMRYRPSGLIYGSDPPELTESLLLSVCREQIVSNPYFSLKTKDAIIRIPLAEIRYFESDRRIVRVTADKITAEFYSKLSGLLVRLPSEGFVRCHNSFIVSLRAVSRLNKSERCLILTSGERIEISKKYYAGTLSAFEAFGKEL